MWNSKKKSSSARKSMIDEAAAEKIFADIADDDDPTVAGMEGICTLCEEQLGIDALEDIRVLVMLWKLGSKEKPAQISKDEWMSGCQKLQIDSIAKLKDLLPSLDTGFLDQAEFKDFYKVTKEPTSSLAIETTRTRTPHRFLLLFRFSFAFNSTDKGRIEHWTRRWSLP
jgi:hypothetical protein